MPTSEHNPKSALERRVQQLEDTASSLESALARLIDMNVMENVLVNGFSELSARLEPLRELLPESMPLTESDMAGLREISRCMEGLRKAMDRPTWNATGALGIVELPVRFIGEPAYSGSNDFDPVSFPYRSAAS